MTSYGKKMKRNEEEICLHKESMLDKLIKERYEPIAIVGVGIRFPGKANNFKDFIKVLENGIDCIEEIPKSRWDNDKFYDNRKGIPGKIYTHSGGYIDDFDSFDAKFFSISPKEANNVDPQQRLLLELTWEALEHANIDPNSLRGGNGSVYFGASTIDYAKKTVDLNDDALCSQMGTGTANSAIAGRVSYFLGLQGPSMVVDTACSSSLVAIHLAIQALRLRETDISFCGGVNIVHHYSSHVIFSQANMLSPDGRCKTFDDSADGYGRSEGAGVIILKRLSDAINNEDNILAIIRGSSVLQDGESGGLTVPNGLAQEQVMKQALDNSLLSPADISYVEAHGTGTPLGDPIEFNAISQVFNECFELTKPLYISSVKTNIGHMEAAAGIGGIIKVVAQMINGKIYKHLHLKSPSKHIQWDKVSITVPGSTLLWNDKKKRALVNSFGFSGTISSLAIEEAPVLAKNCSNKYETEGFLLTVSAKTESALEKMLQRYLDAINEIDAEKIRDFCHLSNIARAHFTHRCAAIVDNKEQCINFLKSRIDLIKNKHAPSNIERYKNNKIVFLFSGQGW
jgi:acyl transferase domain-containing protein